ncbi:MAG: helix-turn-helix domain-containing protein [Planctomycetota bacterium]
MGATHRLFAQLRSRRARLGMSKADLARRAQVSLPTVHRLLSGREKRARTDIVAAIAAALGVEVRLSDSPHVHESSGVSEFRRAQARAKARRLAKLVQGTMALEAEAVGTDVLEELEEQNVHALLAGPGRRLWGD